MATGGGPTHGRDSLPDPQITMSGHKALALGRDTTQTGGFALRGSGPLRPGIGDWTD